MHDLFRSATHWVPSGCQILCKTLKTSADFLLLPITTIITTTAAGEFLWSRRLLWKIQLQWKITIYKILYWFYFNTQWHLSLYVYVLKVWTKILIAVILGGGITCTFIFACYFSIFLKCHNECGLPLKYKSYFTFNHVLCTVFLIHLLFNSGLSRWIFIFGS